MGKTNKLYNQASLKKQDFNSCLQICKVLFHGKVRCLQKTKISQPLYFQSFFPDNYLKKHCFSQRVIKQLEVNPATILFQHTNVFIDKAVIPLNNLST